MSDVERLTYTFDEVCQALGVSEHIVREWTHRASRPLPHVRSRGRLLYPREGVRHWLLAESRSWSYMSDVVIEATATDAAATRALKAI